MGEKNDSRSIGDLLRIKIIPPRREILHAEKGPGCRGGFLIQADS